MSTTTDREDALRSIAYVLRVECRDYLKLKQHVDDPAPGIMAEKIVEHLERAGFVIVRGRAPR